MSSFHPLKAGRRPTHARQLGEQGHLFPSPQGGSETVETVRAQKGQVSFHPLKAGRRPTSTATRNNKRHCFHPLKAGRRQLLSATKP